MSDYLSAAQRTALLGIARAALQARLAGEVFSPPDITDEVLKRHCGAFVTLRGRTESGQLRLRGCIGTFEQDMGLVEVVAKMVEAAALFDPRFPAVELDELPELVIEISVLTPRIEVSADEVQVGVHGLSLSRGAARGVLLPQVAVENGWDRETFLDQTCRKAGMEAGCWRDPHTRIEVFTAEVFGEE